MKKDESLLPLDPLLAAANAIDKSHSNKSLFARKYIKRYVKPSHIHRRPPQRSATLQTDLYISKSTNFISALQRAHKILNNPNIGFCIIHGLGATIQKAASIALRIDAENPGIYERDVETSNVACFDDVENPKDNQQESHVQKRNTSAIHIRIFKKKSVGLI